MTHVRLVTCCLFISWLAGARALGAAPRQAIPDAKSQAAAESTIKSLYKDDYAKHGAADRIALAAKLLKLSDDTGNDPAARFVLLQQAQDLATQAGDAVTALGAIDAEAAAFDVDALRLKIIALSRLAPSSRTAQANRDLVDAALGVSDDASSGEHFDSASQAAAIASSAAEKSHDNALIASARDRAAAVEHRRRAFEKYEQALKALKQNPSDVDANTAVGKYLCLSVGDWEKGLEYLSHGSDDSLQSLAKRELATPAKSAQMQALADDWWQWAEKADRAERVQAKSHAATWYARALPDLNGLGKALVEKRIAEAEASVAPQRIVDLRPLIDPKRDSVAGSWKVEGNVLTDMGNSQSGDSRLRILYQPPPEYDFRITFVRVEGNDAVEQLVSSKNKAVALFIGGYGDTISGFEAINDKGFREGATAVSGQDVLKVGVRHTSVIRVRRDSIAAYLDGKQLTSYRTDFSDVTGSAHWQLTPGGLGLGGWSSHIEFQTIELIEVTGHGNRVPPP